MTGIEKITARIQEDAQQEIDAVLAEAKAQADGIAARYAGQAKQATAEILEKGERSAEECRPAPEQHCPDGREKTGAVHQAGDAG